MVKFTAKFQREHYMGARAPTERGVGKLQFSANKSPYLTTVEDRTKVTVTH